MAETLDTVASITQDSDRIGKAGKTKNRSQNLLVFPGYYFFPLLLQKLIWIPSRLLLKIFGRLEVYGLEHIKDIKSNAIFAMNHTSEIDPFIVPTSLPFWSHFSPLFYATREKKFYDKNGWRKYLFGGLFINMWGGYTAHAGLHDYAKSLVDHATIIRAGWSFCVFPEGGISTNGIVQPGKGGVSYLAEVGQCPIVPVGVSGVFRTTFPDFFMRRRRIIIRFGTPIYQRELTINNIERSVAFGSNVYKEEANYVMRKIKELLSK